MSDTADGLASDLVAYRVTLTLLRRLVVEHIGDGLGRDSDELHAAVMALGRALDDAGLSVRADVDRYLIESEHANPARAWVAPSERYSARGANGWGAPAGSGYSDEPPF